MSCRSRLSNLNEKLTEIERKVDYLEAKVARSGETPAWSKNEVVDCVSVLLSILLDQINPARIVAKEILFFARPRWLKHSSGDEQKDYTNNEPPQNSPYKCILRVSSTYFYSHRIY